MFRKTLFSLFILFLLIGSESLTQRAHSEEVAPKIKIVENQKTCSSYAALYHPQSKYPDKKYKFDLIIDEVRNDYNVQATMRIRIFKKDGEFVDTINFDYICSSGSMTICKARLRETNGKDTDIAVTGITKDFQPALPISDDAAYALVMPEITSKLYYADWKKDEQGFSEKKTLPFSSISTVWTISSCNRK